MTKDTHSPRTRSTTYKGIRVFDTTLRDGEQSPGATLNSREKLVIARQLSRLGVDVIEAGFPASSRDDLKAVQQISQQVGAVERTALPGGPGSAPPTIAAMARANRQDIDLAWQGVLAAKSPCIHIVLPASDIHLKHKLGKSHAEVLEIARQTVGMAYALCGNVEFSPEDATRSDPGFLLDMLEIAAEMGAETLNIPDTVGYAMPAEYGALIRKVSDQFLARPEVVISCHCHDDLGLATANTLAGLENGCRQIEVTINGIGERAGNACLEEVIMALRTRKSLFQLETAIDPLEILPSSALVSELTGLVVPPNKAIVGANAFLHESGIHQDGILKHRQTYEIMDATVLGLRESRLVLGKHSGRNALRARLRALGYSLNDAELAEAFARFKSLADKHKTVSDPQLQALCTDLVLPCEEPAQ